MRTLSSRFPGPEQGGLGGGLRGMAGNPRTFAIVALGVVWTVLAWPWLSGRVTIPWDAKAQFLPQLQFLARSFAEGQSPFWAPYVFAGHPQIADPQSLIFSPPYLLLAWLNPAPTAWAADATLYVLLLLSAAAMLIWLTDKGWHPAASLVAALSFAFGAAMAWRVQHIGQVMSLAYLPVVLLCLDRALDRKSLIYGAAAGIAAGLLVLGRDQVALLSIYFLVAYVASQWWQSPQRTSFAQSSFAPLSIAAVAGIAVIAVPVVLTALVAADSNRPSIDLEGAGRGSLHPALLLTALAPDAFGSSGVIGEYWGPPSGRWGDTGLYLAQNMGQMYIGALPALALIWAAFAGVLWRREVRVVTVSLGIALFYALGWYTPVFALFHAFVPGVDLYRRPADAVFLIGFLASVLAGYAVHCWLMEADRALPLWRRAGMIALPVAAFAVMLALALNLQKLDVAWPYIAIPVCLFIAATLVLAAFHRSGNALAVTALAAAFMAGDLAFSNGPGGATALPPAMFDVLDPATRNDTISLLKQKTNETRDATRRDRVEIVGFGFHWPNASLTHGLEATLGYNPLRLGHFTRATGAGDTVGLPDQKGFSPLMPSYRSTLADLLGLRFIATSVPIEEIDKNLQPGDLTFVAKTTDGFIYENPRALPRVLFAGQSLKADFEAMLTSGTWPNFDPSTTVLLEQADRGAAGRSGDARIISYGNTKITIDADSPDGGFVVLNDIWQPWWFATVDGKPADLLRANVLFRAVAVPPGKHTVTFSFSPLRGAMKQLGWMQEK
jgi:hypothetical protein